MNYQWLGIVVGVVAMLGPALALWRMLDALHREAQFISTVLVSLRNLTRVLIEQRDDARQSKKTPE